MEDLIKALKILSKYQEPTDNPTICIHDYLIVHSVNFVEVSLEDRHRLYDLGFEFSEEYGWRSSRFGSA